jgi:hypothetical protein
MTTKTNQERIALINKQVADGVMSKDDAKDLLDNLPVEPMLVLSQTLKISTPPARDDIKTKKGRGQNSDITYDGIKCGYVQVSHTNKVSGKDGISASLPLSCIIDLYTHKDAILNRLIEKCESGHLFAERNQRRISQLTPTDPSELKSLLG